MVTRILSGHPLSPNGTREFFDAARRETVEAGEIARSQLDPGMKVSGPAVVVEDETTTIVTSNYTVTEQNDGSLLLQRKGGAP